MTAEGKEVIYENFVTSNMHIGLAREVLLFPAESSHSYYFY